VVIRVVAIVVVSFAAGVPAGFVLGMNRGEERQAEQRSRDFFEPPPKKEKFYQEMKPRW
jgi:ABC-type anion transport system duplicated permease subunit